MPKSKLVMKDVNRSDVPITFEFSDVNPRRTSEAGHSHPLGYCLARRVGVPLHTCLAENAVVVRDGVWCSSMVVAVERGLYGPQA